MNKLFEIKGKVVVYTGATGVLGQTISKYLASEGAILVVLGRSSQKGESLVSEIKSQGGKSAFYMTDILNEESLTSAQEEIVKTFGKVDVLINGAGGNMPNANIPPDKLIYDLSIEAMRDVVDVNLFGTILPTMVFAKGMKGEGVVLNFSSESSLRPLTRVFGYGAAKAAINNATKFLATEFATKFGEKMRVNAIAPGFFLTDQNRSLLTDENGNYTDRANKIIAHTPFGRFGKPEELCGTVHYLISEASAFVTGTVAVVDGGFDAFSI